MKRQAHIRTLLLSTLYPSSVRPGHGIFVEARLRELLRSGQVQTKVVAPVPWFFSTNPRYGNYARMARTPARERFHGIDVQYPRYVLPPKVGMNIAPFTLAIGAIPAVRRALEEGFDFDLIDAHYYYPDGVAAALLALYFKKPFVVTARGSDINLVAKFTVPCKFIRWAASRASASIGVSTALVNAMLRLGLDEARLLMIRNGVDLARFRPIPKQEARAALGWSVAPTLLSVGNLVENKGHHLAIEALANLPNFCLAIVGEGPERRSLEALSRRMGLSARVTFVGQIPQDDLPRFYSAADILVLPSSREGWPNVLLESMACGTPVVATDVGGVSEIVTSSVAGRMISARASADLVAAVNSTWSCYPDSSLVRAHAARYNWRNTTDAQLELFHKIVGAQHGLTQA